MQVTRPNGTTLEWTRDGEGRATRLDITRGLTTVGTTLQAWSRDGFGRVVSAFDDNGMPRWVETESFYDSLGRVLRESQLVLGAGPSSAVDTSWKGLDAIQFTFPDGRKIWRTPDALHRTSQLQEAAGHIARFDYVGSRLARRTLGNGLVLDRLNVQETGTIGGTLPGYDANGRPVRSRWVNGLGSPVLTLGTGYNGPGGIGTNRIAGETVTTYGLSGGTQANAYEHDSAYREIAFDRDGTVSSRDLDGANKMTAFLDEGVARNPIVDGDPTQDGMNQYSAFAGAAREYAVNGGFADDGKWSYAYDAFDRLVEVKDNGVPVARYLYDASNRRAYAERFGPNTRYISSGWQVVEERDWNDSLVRQYVGGDGLDTHVQMLDAATGGRHYFHGSPLGTTWALSDASGQLAERYDYSWLGRPTVIDALGATHSSSPLGNPYLFQGREWEPDVPLYQYRNRWYSPFTGEFTTVDPLGVWAHGMGNGYDAFGGAGWTAIDPMGEYPLFFGPQFGRETPAAVASGAWAAAKDSIGGAWAAIRRADGYVRDPSSLIMDALVATPDAVGLALDPVGSAERTATGIGTAAFEQMLEMSLDPSGAATGHALGYGGFMATEACFGTKGANFARTGLSRVGALARAVETADDLVPVPTLTVADDAARGTAPLRVGTRREMLGEALDRVRWLEGTAAQKADLFEDLAGYITRRTDGGWSAARSAGADGSHIFAGKMGEALVIAPDGSLFRGTILPGSGQFTVGSSGQLNPVYGALRPVR